MSSRMSRAVPALLLSLLLPAATVALAAPAHADRWTYDDAAGDVTHMAVTETSLSVETAPEQANGDITQVVVDHGRKRVTILVRTRTAITGAFGASVDLRTRGHYFVLTWMRAPGVGGVELMDFKAKKEKDMVVKCPGLKRKLVAERTTLRLSVPRSCLDDPRWVRVGVSLSTFGMFTGQSYDDDGLRTGMTLAGTVGVETGRSPKIRR
ncbi:hypothetical protein [Nocardioides nitrophenolicus]|uniref:hypothetical protein n=1 Tax=Nocardioides nitrophenolicus TaxID=60489 RepID=UPI001957A12B|nr:hypothetical protein [Nocardioides nitrophenolicus]MBM7519838.1 hypothetical protein [Nocardioides nitrophenolicus]